MLQKSLNKRSIPYSWRTPALTYNNRFQQGDTGVSMTVLADLRRPFRKLSGLHLVSRDLSTLLPL